MTITLHMAESEHMNLTRAILLYEQRYGNRGFATLHQVCQQGASPVIGAGQCLTRDALEDILTKLLNRPAAREILPANVLWSGDSRLCWYVPAARRPIFFKTRNEKFNKEMNGREVMHPNLVFIGRPGRLSVWALNAGQRPTGDTKLYQAPYFNIYDTGQMCNGNAKLPDVPTIDALARYERAFFETNFTHTNVQKLVRQEGGHDAFWRLQAGKHALAPDPVRLLPLKLTLQEALNQ